MIKFIESKRGFYTVEAAIFLPLLILAVLTIGFFINADSAWENAMHAELDACSRNAASHSIGVHTRKFTNSLEPALPIGFAREYDFEGRIKYRDFKGHSYPSSGMGVEGLESSQNAHGVWIFPLSGERYHTENCTYVKATVHSAILSDSLKRKYSPCGLCHSKEIPTGSIVFCFSGGDTSYHYGSCRSIKRHTVVIDREEAKKKGYTPCSKCGT